MRRTIRRAWGWFGLALLVTAVPGAVAGAAADTPPVFPPPAPNISAENRAVLDPWTGRWAGSFVVYAPDGAAVTRLTVEQHYRWDGSRQRATFEETDGAGNVVTAEATNYQGADGRLVCTVVKSTGERSLHFGRVTDGYLFWSAERPGTRETFRERVEVGDDGVRRYAIDGFGVYGDDAYLFAGSYREVPD